MRASRPGACICRWAGLGRVAPAGQKRTQILARLPIILVNALKPEIGLYSRSVRKVGVDGGNQFPFGSKLSNQQNNKVRANGVVLNDLQH